MANSGKMNTGTNPRILQYGLDRIIKHFDNEYKGEGDKIFERVKATKGFYEMLQLAGVGLAARKGEGDVLTYDSVDQDWNARFPIYTYEKSARITMEAMEDNVYEDWMADISGELVKAHRTNQDYQMAYVLNNATSTTALVNPDGVALMSTSHPIQAGGTNSNRLSPDLDLSEDAVEQAVFLVDGFVNPDGLVGEYEAKTLVIPKELKYVAERICGSKYRTSTSDNDINAVMNRGDIQGYMYWKRLTSTSTWFITTTAKNGLILAEKKGITTKTSNDPFTYDMIISSHTRFGAFYGDYRCLVGSVGP